MITNCSSWKMKEKDMEEGRERGQRKMREQEDTKTPLFEDWKAKKEAMLQRAKIPEKNRML